ncbi:type II secretion system protein, partial [bacterium]|nr:type II secretion system protein [bacterium]
HRRQIFDWKHHALVLISYVKNLRNRRSLLLPLRGFTLAEVLITLGIIGVVAALTIPTLMQKIDERETVSKVKKFYSVFSEAYKLAVFENGKFEEWNLEDTDEGRQKFYEIISPYLKTVEFKGFKADTTESEQGIIFPDGTLISGLWLNPSGCNTGVGKCGDIYFKVNNKIDTEKRANEFVFDIASDRILPYGVLHNDGRDKTSCLTQATKQTCTNWVLTHENMDYLHCNDLNWYTKTKCD